MAAAAPSRVGRGRQRDGNALGGAARHCRRRQDPWHAWGQHEPARRRRSAVGKHLLPAQVSLRYCSSSCPSRRAPFVVPCGAGVAAAAAQGAKERAAGLAAG